jgi:PcfJ-like protein
MQTTLEATNVALTTKPFDRKLVSEALIAVARFDKHKLPKGSTEADFFNRALRNTSTLQTRVFFIRGLAELILDDRFPITDNGFHSLFRLYEKREKAFGNIFRYGESKLVRLFGNKIEFFVDEIRGIHPKKPESFAAFLRIIANHSETDIELAIFLLLPILDLLDAHQAEKIGNSIKDDTIFMRFVLENEGKPVSIVIDELDNIYQLIETLNNVSIHMNAYGDHNFPRPNFFNEVERIEQIGFYYYHLVTRFRLLLNKKAGKEMHFDNIVSVLDEIMEFFSFQNEDFVLHEKVPGYDPENPVSFKQYIEYLPVFVLTNLDFFELPIKLSLAKGKSISEAFNIRMTKSTAHAFTLIKKSDVQPEKVFGYAKLTGLGISKFIIDDLFRFVDGDFHFISHRSSEFYIEAARFLQRHLSDFGALNDNERTSLLGYISHLNRDVRGFSFKGRSFASVMRLKTEYEAIIKAEGLKTGADKTEISNAKHQIGKGYFITPLLTEYALQKEGIALHHCVGGYYESVRTGNRSIFSLRKSKGGASLVTIEVMGNMIVQARAKYNAIPSQEFINMIKKWARTKGFVIQRL